MSRLFQSAFGKRKTLVKAKNPLPRWQAKSRELKSQSKKRKTTDELKKVIFEQNPNAIIHSIYGTVIIDGKENKFSIDVVRDPSRVSNSQMSIYLKKFYSSLYDGSIPENHYYAVYLSPEELLRAKKIRHQGLADYLAKKSDRFGRKGKFESWTTKRKPLKTIKQLPSRPWREVQWLIVGYKHLISEAEAEIVYLRHKLRELGVKLKPYPSWRIRRAEALFLKEIGWKEAGRN